MSTRPLICFTAILKDEAKSVRATLESVKSFVDCWCVLDTGSTDGTQAIVREVMAGVPGALYEEPFVDYSTSRNRVLELAESLTATSSAPAIYALMLSADETLHGGAELRTFLDEHREDREGAYCVQIRVGTRAAPSVRVLRIGGGWKYHGERHEIPVGPNGETRPKDIPGVSVVHVESDPTRKAARIRDVDVPHFEARAKDESKSLDDRAHAIFYLAESHAFLADECEKAAGGPVPGGPYMTHVMAAMGYYWRYAQIADQPTKPAYDFNKVAYALALFYHLGAKAKVFTPSEIVERMNALLGAAPKLVEAHFMRAQCATLGAKTPVELRLALKYAIEAADAAKHAAANPSTEPQETTVEWRAMSMAAFCAKTLKFPTERVREFAERGMAAGGPLTAFEAYLGKGN